MKTFSQPHGSYNIVKATSMFESEAIDNIYANISVVRYFLVDISNQSAICKSLLPKLRASAYACVRSALAVRKRKHQREHT